MSTHSKENVPAACHCGMVSVKVVKLLVDACPEMLMATLSSTEPSKEIILLLLECRMKEILIRSLK
jgi:hypothetical protein